MKILKVFTLILLFAFAACKKDGGVKPGPDPVVNTPITSAELVDYSIPVQLNVDEGLRVIYFNKDGNDIKATYDAVTVRRIFTVNVVNNTWVMDLNGNGSIIYTFKFGRRDDGQLTLVGGSYKKQADASVKMQALLMKNADIPPLANTHYMESGNTPSYLKFSDDHNFATSNQPNYAGAPWSSYYDLFPGAWKGKYNGVDYMGITIKLKPNEAPTMYLQIAGDGKTHTYNLQNN
nr:hypothetical protein [Mucilaginibacter sp. L294]